MGLYTVAFHGAGVCKACFSNEHMARHGRLMGEYRDQFVRDLDPASPGWPATLGELSGRLKAWRATLQSTVEDSMPPHLRLEDEVRNLQVRQFCPSLDHIISGYDLVPAGA